MGIYDQYHGTCPRCGGQIGRSAEQPGICGVQDKTFITPRRAAKGPVYDFQPGVALPFKVSLKYIIIGPTNCCHCYIIVMFKTVDGKQFIEYEK